MPRTLFIDIDGTLITEPPAAPSDLCIRAYPLLKLMRDHAVAAGQRSAEEATRQIEHLLDTRTWWDWQDYLEVLDLKPSEFWDFADRAVGQLLRPIEGHLDLKLEHLSHAGCRLCITSNNPTSGIRHKLRLAGLGRSWQKQHVDRVFGTDVTRAMKWDRRFWSEAIKLADTAVHSIIVVGNDWHDDVVMPAQEGVRDFVFFDAAGANREADPPGATVRRVQSWAEAVDAILAGRGRSGSGIGVAAQSGGGA